MTCPRRPAPPRKQSFRPSVFTISSGRMGLLYPRLDPSRPDLGPGRWKALGSSNFLKMDGEGESWSPWQRGVSHPQEPLFTWSQVLEKGLRPEVCMPGASYLGVGDVSGASDGVICSKLRRGWPIKYKFTYQRPGLK